MNNHNRFQKYLYFMTDTVVDWVDIFTRSIYKHIILELLHGREILIFFIFKRPYPATQEIVSLAQNDKRKGLERLKNI